MPIVSLTASSPFVDGRQSERALSVRCGIERHFCDLGYVTIAEMTLASGRRADLAALSPKGDILIVEVKSSIADLKSDNKWPDYRDYCDQLYFATLSDVPADIFPNDAGFFVADSYGAEMVREAPEHRLAAARRKTVTLRFARAAALRLQRCMEHSGMDVAQLYSEDE